MNSGDAPPPLPGQTNPAADQPSTLDHRFALTGRLASPWRGRCQPPLSRHGLKWVARPGLELWPGKLAPPPRVGAGHCPPAGPQSCPVPPLPCSGRRGGSWPRPGSTICWPAFSSTSSSVEVAAPGPGPGFRPLPLPCKRVSGLGDVGANTKNHLVTNVFWFAAGGGKMPQFTARETKPF